MTKDSCTWNSTQNTESAVVWNWESERWGSALVQGEKCRGGKGCDRRHIIIIIIISLHGLYRLSFSGIDALPSFAGASTISSSSKFVVEGLFRKSRVVHSFKMVDPVLFVQGGSNMTGTDLCVNKPHCAAAVRP